MFTVHLISDLYFGFNEPTPEEELNIPEEVDLIVINGNIGAPKRSMYYAHELCKKYPDRQVIWNPGETEKYWGNMPKESEWEFDDATKIRKSSSSDWPDNLHWKDPRDEQGILVTLRNGQTVDVYTDYGFPKILSYGGRWEDTYWYRNYGVVGEYVHNLHKWDHRPVEADIVQHGVVPIWFTVDYMNTRFKEAETRIRNWELSLKSREQQGLIVTHINPYTDDRCKNCSASFFNIHIKNMYWLTTGESNRVNYLGGKLYCNSGRGAVKRSQVVQIN